MSTVLAFASQNDGSVYLVTPLVVPGCNWHTQARECDSPGSQAVTRCADDAVRCPPYPSAVKVLGIDPGTAACGYGIVHESDGRLRAVAHGVWRTPAGTRLELRL